MPLLWLSLAFLAGVWLGQMLGWPATWWGGLALVSLVLLILRPVLGRGWSNIPRLTLRLPNPDGFPASQIPFFLILFSLAAGGLRYQIGQPRQDEQFIASYNDLGAAAFLQGVVVRPPDERDRYTLLTVLAV